MTGWADLDRFLHTDPRDVGCEQAMELLHVDIELVLNDSPETAAHHHPGITAHLLACGPCAEDYTGLLAAATSTG
jgi:hypothetical protein